MGKKRRRLRDKIAACGLQGSKQFGEDLLVAAQKNHNVVDAKLTLYGSDGAANMLRFGPEPSVSRISTCNRSLVTSCHLPPER